MVTQITTFSAIIALWPTAAAMGADLGVKCVTVRAWRARGIPAKYWPEVVVAGRHRGFAISVDLLAHIAARQAGRSDDVSNSDEVAA